MSATLSNLFSPTVRSLIKRSMPNKHGFFYLPHPTVKTLLPAPIAPLKKKA